MKFALNIFQGGITLPKYIIVYTTEQWLVGGKTVTL